MNPSFEFDDPDRVTVGTVGPAGQRTFFIQARQRNELATLKVEKEQVRQLAEYFQGVLQELPPPDDQPTDLDLESPVHQDWVVGTIRVAPYDESTDRVHVLLEEFVPETDEDDDDVPLLARAQIAMRRAQVAAFVERAGVLLKAGRPTCVLCGNPKDPAGHVCPRTNGHAG